MGAQKLATFKCDFDGCQNRTSHSSKRTRVHFKISGSYKEFCEPCSTREMRSLQVRLFQEGKEVRTLSRLRERILIVLTDPSDYVDPEKITILKPPSLAI